MEDYRTQFRDLLFRLFQFDTADLDFGIYRILNFKRDVISRFIEKDLLDAVAEELDSGALAEQSENAKQLEELAGQIKELLGEDALDGEGELTEKHRPVLEQKGKVADLARRYVALRGAAHGAKPRQAVEAAIFNHLYTFFSRYYDAGDFMSKRRYSRKEKYAVPYNGEEVYLHWANKDQYYVKTGEYFTDYRFISRGLTAHFRLQVVDVEKDNVKGDRRFFVPLVKQATFDEKAKEVVIPFEYRPLTEQEGIRYGQKNQQEAIIAEALESVPKHFAKEDKVLSALMVEKRKDSTERPVSFLEHHLRQYTRRNTSDFFIHKDLKGFLERELDFYLKNEVLNVDDLEAVGEGRAAAWFQTMRAMKAVGSMVIAFLAQIEDFQKKLFEKRKFITETNYCVTMAAVPEEFHGEVAANDAQWEEWKEFLHIDEEEKNIFTAAAKTKKDRRVTFLRAHPTLVLDTKHFEREFMGRLLSSFDDLDEQTDGLLIQGDNFQALSLMMEKYRGRIACMYLDPPFNTSEESFLYKNDYKHSSWLSMMQSRAQLSTPLLAPNGTCLVAIDDEEMHRLRGALEHVFGPGSFLGLIVLQSNPRGRTIDSFFATTHEYALLFAPNPDQAEVHPLPLTDDQAADFSLQDKTSDYRLLPFRRSGGLSTPAERPNSEYPIFYDPVSGRIDVEDFMGAMRIMPTDRDGRRRVWRQTRPSLLAAVARGDIVIKERESKFTVYMKDRIKYGRKPKSIWNDPKYDASSHGTVLLQNILGERRLFSYPKSLNAVIDSIRTLLGNSEAPVVLDFFAGSGTTGHAVIALNRDDGLARKFILVEMGHYFDTVLLPRIKCITYSPEWKAGRPSRAPSQEEMDNGPRLVKYLRIESYEDTLNNIAFSGQGGQETLGLFDDYLLSYMLEWETKESDTLLNVEKLATPFAYKLLIAEDGETKEKQVDLPETFNYLLGLRVRSRKVYSDKGRAYLVYRGKADGRQVAVIWRETKDWKAADFERDKKYVAEQKLTEGADEIFVNSDSVIPGAKSLDPVFKARMFAPVAAGNRGN